MTAFRRLFRQKAAAATLIAVLGLTAGVTASVVEVIAAYLWRPLSYPFADRLAIVEFPRENGPSPLDLQRVDWSGLAPLADLVVAGDVDAFTVIGADVPFSVDGRWLSADAFAAFGVTPAAGRFFTDAEAKRGERLAVIGHEVWQDHYGGEPSAIGRTLTARATLRQGQPEQFTIVGVLPPRFWHLEDRTNLVLPLTGPAPPMVLRVRPEVSFSEAARRVTALVRTQVASVGEGWTATVHSAQDGHVEGIRPMLAATGWSVILLAAVAFANLTFLQIARGIGNQREMAVRAVLGASGRVLTREVLADGAAIGAVSAVVAIVVGAGILGAGVPAIEHYFGRLIPGTVGESPLVGLATIAACLAAGIVLASIMLIASRVPVLPAALAGHPSATATPARSLALQLVSASQVAVAFCLLVAAGLMIRSAWHLRQLDLGFEPRGVLSANVTLHEGSYRSLAERKRFFNQLVERIEQLPEVNHAGLTGWLPFRVGPVFGIEPVGAASQPSIGASIQPVNPQYFPALQMRLVAGRLISADDRETTPRVAVISRALAQSLWRSDAPVGRAFRIRFNGAEPGRPGFGPFTIVGVVDDSLRSLVEPTPPQVYLPFDQQPIASNAFLQVKTSRPPLDTATAVARVLREADANVPLASVSTLAELVQANGRRPVFLARVLSGLSLLGFTMALIGLHAVSAWLAIQRQREAALRVALGAGPGSVALLLARRGLIATVGGVAVGWWLTSPLTNLLITELHGVAATDVSMRLTIALLLGAISALALWRPVWRAATANLTALLRTD